MKDENVPLMVLGVSASEDLVIPNKKAFAQRRIMQTATVKNITVNQSTPVRIGDLAGYTTLAEGKGKDADTALTVYQVILYDDDGYYLIQGLTPSAKREVHLPVFEKIAKSFALKESRNKAE